MYIKPFQLDFVEKHFDETASTFHTTHLSIGDYLDFPNSIPIDVQCKSTEKQKDFYLVYSNSMNIGNNARILITVKNNNGQERSFSSHQHRSELCERHYRDRMHFFSISEEDFKSCCLASSLEVEIDEDNGTQPTKENRDELIDFCKLLYQEVFDKNAFPETANYLQKKQKDLATIINKQNNNN